jgi:hypothetical protein
MVSVIKVCLNKTYSRFGVSKHFSDTFLGKEWLKQEDALLPLLFYRVLDYADRRAKENQKGLKLNGPHELWFMLMMRV